MTVRLVRKNLTPKVSYAEYSGYCIHTQTTEGVCPFCGSEVRSILRKAMNA